MSPSRFGSYPVCKDGQDKFARLESVQDFLDDTQIRGQRDVALEADIRKFRLRSDMNSHVLTL